MTEVEKKEIWDAKKLSRTWRITVWWNILALVALLTQAVMTSLGSSLELPIGPIVTFAGSVTLGYLGKRAVQEVKGEH